MDTNGRNLIEEIDKESKLREKAEEERDRLKRARDELAKECLLLERRANDAEEELRTTKEQLKEALSPPEKSARALQKDVEILLRELEREQERNRILEEELESAKADSSEAIERMLVAEKQVKILRSSLKSLKSEQEKNDKKKDSREANGKKKEEMNTESKTEDKPGKIGVVNELQPHVGEHKKLLASLKLARDKLISEMDSQASEIERLGTENISLASAVIDAKNAAAGWEAQAQAGLAQCSKLKDILEESAQWDEELIEGQDGACSNTVESIELDSKERENMSSNGQQEFNGQILDSVENDPEMLPQQGSRGDLSADYNDRDCTSHLQSKCNQLEKKLLAQTTRRAALETQVIALCSELTRCSTQAAALHRFVIPMLTGIEQRLQNVLHNNALKGDQI